jgi:prepilin-type N-terminal cleavage/methylation domain-containing protein
MRQGAREDERGFTVIEMLVTIIIMGIVLTIAFSSWFGVVESRRVDSATNQLAADLRLAHSRATNRLAQQTVTLTAGSSEYTATGLGTRDLDDDPDEHLVTVAAPSTVVFQSSGEAQVTGPNPIEVRATNNAGNNHTVMVNTTTSRIQIVP